MRKTLSFQSENLLEGPLFSKILLFSLPLMATNLLQMLYTAADMMIVGMSGVEGAIGSIGTTGSFIHLVLHLFVGLSVGANVVVARNIGRNNLNRVEKSVHTSILVGLFSGILCGVVGIIISRSFLAFLGDEGFVLNLATLYCRIYFAGVPFLALTNFQIAILRAEGDTRTPLYILAFTGLLNVGLNLLFVLVFHMSVDGVAIATVISNAVSTILLAIRLMNDSGMCRISLPKLKIDYSSMKEIFRDGLPAGIQGALFSISNLAIQSTIIGINNAICPGGSGILDGSAAANNLEQFAYTATSSVYQASITFTSQHFGAKLYKRIGTVIRDCYAITAIISITIVTIVLGFRSPLISLYVSSELAVRTAETRLYTILTFHLLQAFMEVGSGILRGLGRPMVATAITLAGSCLFRIFWVYVIFPLRPTLETVFFSYPVSWGLTALVNFVTALIIRRNLIRKQNFELSQSCFNA